jgi:hypothetical protein
MSKIGRTRLAVTHTVVIKNNATFPPHTTFQQRPFVRSKIDRGQPEAAEAKRDSSRAEIE